MLVVASPAFKSKHKNPYTSSLYEELCRLGVEVREYSPRELMRPQAPDIWHVHWPESLLNYPSKPKVIFKFVKFMAQVYWAKIRGVRLVWTVHNLGAHEQAHAFIERLFWSLFIARVSAVINLTDTGRKLALARFPQLQGKLSFTIAHGHFRGSYSDRVSAAAAREALGCSSDNKILLYLGQVREYKNVPQLIDAFRQLPDADARLVVAGKIQNSVLGDTIKAGVRQDARIIGHFSFIAPDQIQNFFRAADLVVLPYEEILNSGMALLALSFDCPVLVPDKGSLRELQNDVGDEWLALYQGNTLTGGMLADALSWARAEGRQEGPDLSAYDWPGIAQRSADAYAKILALGR